MRAITIREPWLSCILFRDQDVVNRNHPFPKSSLGQPIALHCSREIDKYDFAGLDIQERIHVEKLLPKHHIVAIARITKCTYGKSKSRWAAEGHYQWHRTVDHILQTPIPIKGAPNLWELPPAVEAAIYQQIKQGA